MTSIKPDNHATIRRPDWLSEQAWPFRVQTAAIEGTVVAYTDEGSGPTLLLIHDGLCSYLWIHLIERLRDRFRVVTLDFPGAGLSPKADSHPRLETDSGIVEGLVELLGLTHITLVVHDLGGSVGLGFATRHPESIDRLVLINTFAWPATTPGLRAMLRLMGSGPMTAINSGTNLIARTTSTRFGVGRHYDREQKRAFIAMFRRKTSRQRFNALMSSAMSETVYLSQVESDLDQLVSKPVLTIFGERNDPFHFQEKWREHFPHVEQVIIPGGYHFPMCDDPDQVAGQIARWCENG